MYATTSPTPISSLSVWVSILQLQPSSGCPSVSTSVALLVTGTTFRVTLAVRLLPGAMSWSAAVAMTLKIVLPVAVGVPVIRPSRVSFKPSGKAAPGAKA